MNVIVIGGGVVGITTAYYLSQAGMTVTVLEQREHAGREASLGNAGFLSPSDSFAWASPSALKMAIKSLIDPSLGLQYKFHLDPDFWSWSIQFLNQCRSNKWENNSDIKYQLAKYSLSLIDEVRRDTGIDFDASNDGILYACRNQQSFDELQKHYQFLQNRGLELEFLERDSLLKKLPVLNSNKDTYAGAVYSPSCKTGDSAKFSQNLASWCTKNKECQFLWGTSVEKIMLSNNKITGIWTSKGELKADAYVLAAGAHSGILAKQVGVKLPIYPIKGFSITAPIINEEIAPTTGFDDIQRLIAVSKIGNRLRMSSSAVFDGFNKSHRPQDFKSILKLAREIFPDVADYNQAEYWAGLRPMTPSSVPIVGKSSVSNLFLNVGHGHLGWTMSCGTAQIIADIVAGKKPFMHTSI